MYEGGLVKISVAVKRNPNVSAEEFHKHWGQQHAAMVENWLTNYGIVRYVQFHVSEESKQMAAAGGMPPGMFSDFDGLAEMWMHDFDDFVRATRDPYYLEKIRPDEQYLLDTSASRVTMGREVELIRDGRDCFE